MGTTDNSMIGKFIPKAVFELCAATKKERKLSAKPGCYTLAGVNVTADRIEFTNGHFYVCKPNPLMKEESVTGILSTESKSKLNGDSIVASEIAGSGPLTTYSGELVERIDGNYPDTEWIRTQKNAGRRISFNVEYLRTIADCFDLDKSNSITLECGSETDPIKIYPTGDRSQGYAILMPIRP